MLKESGLLIRFILILSCGLGGGLLAHQLLFWITSGLLRRTESDWATILLRKIRRPFGVLMPLIALLFLLPLTAPAPGLAAFLKSPLSLAIIGAVAWILIRLAAGLEAIALTYYRIDVEDNLRARRINTQITMLKRITIAVIGVIAFASMLMVFDKVRQLGTSILASAGIVGVIVGFAAQRSIATLLAGLQIAITQPIRLDDVVVVENEWGRVEEITLTYVVVRIWDQRRLVLPMTYFIEKPFQNWTRTSADILGTVFLYADYSIPVQAIRDKLSSIVKESELWDGRVCTLQVTNASERTVELRALMSARNASDAWSLRCQVREELISYIQQEFPSSLPKLRAEVKPDAEPVEE